MNPGGFNGLPNIKMEDGVMGSMGLKVRTLNIFNIFLDETLWQHSEYTPELTVEKTDDDFDTEHWIFATDLMGSISGSASGLCSLPALMTLPQVSLTHPLLVTKLIQFINSIHPLILKIIQSTYIKGIIWWTFPLYHGCAVKWPHVMMEGNMKHEIIL